MEHCRREQKEYKLEDEEEYCKSLFSLHGVVSALWLPGQDQSLTTFPQRLRRGS